MISGSRQTPEAARNLTLTPVLTLEGHKKAIPSISYFPDGKRMVSGSRDNTARQWDLETGREIKKARGDCKEEVYAVSVSRDGRWVVSAGGNSNTRGELRVCEVETGTVRTCEGHSRRINCIDISADGTLLASGAEDFTVRIWSLETGKLVAGPFKNIDGWVDALRFSQDSKKLAVKSSWWNYLEVWDVQTQKLDVKVGTFGGANFTFAPVFWTTKDKTIITAFSLTWHSPKTIYELDASTLETVGAPFEGHTKVIVGLALSFDCALLASASHDNTIKLWDFQSRQLLASFKVMYARHLIFSPDSRQIGYTTLLNTNIYLCNTPPEVLASIQQIRASNPPLADSCAISLTPTSEASPNAQQSFPSHSLPHPPISFASHKRKDTGIIISPRGTSSDQKMERWPADTQSSSAKMWGQHYELRFQPSRQDPLHSNGGPTIPSSTVASWSPQLPPDPRELLPSSSHTDTVLTVLNDEPDNILPEAMLQDLSKYITKDGDYPVARGGFGEIWKCTFHINRRSVKVAVKALQVYADDQLGAAKTKKIKRIKRELRICANLNHPNILPIYGYTYGFGPFLAIVSPWAENGDLTVYLEREGAALTLIRRFQMLRDIIAGLQYLHANSVVHGDFNGPNVLIHGDGTACVADFGLSLMYSEVITASQASWTSTLKGNMRWMAPELLVPEKEDGSSTRPSEQSDIFSFGGIMLQVLTNKTPYYYLPNDAAIVLCIARSETPCRARYPELPEKYWQFIEQCWSTNPWDRPSTEGADTAIRNEFCSLSRSH